MTEVICILTQRNLLKQIEVFAQNPFCPCEVPLGVLQERNSLLLPASRRPR